MASMTQRVLLAGLQEEAGRQIDLVRSEFAALGADELHWHPSPKDWNILQCFDHLNETHSYYARRIQAAERQPLSQTGADAPYHSSFWGRIYMNFAFNPRLSFPARGEIAPGTNLSPAVLATWFDHQATLMAWFQDGAQTDLAATRISIKGRVAFNLGDVLSILIRHNDLHIGQAQRVLAQLRSAPANRT